MKPIMTLFAAGCVATFAVALSPVSALAQCEPLKSRLHQATELEKIHRKNAANRRDLHNETYATLSNLRKAIQQTSKEKCKGDQACERSEAIRSKNIAKRVFGLDADELERRLERIQADLDKVSGKLEATVAEKKFVSGELEKCLQKEAAAAAARKKAGKAAARARSNARARRRAAERERREAEEAARAAAAAAAVGAMIGNMGRSRGGISRGRPRRGGGCPPGMRRSADNPNCHYPGGRRRW
jgi:hypothetical protein